MEVNAMKKAGGIMGKREGRGRKEVKKSENEFKRSNKRRRPITRRKRWRKSQKQELQ